MWFFFYEFIEYPGAFIRWIFSAKKKKFNDFLDNSIINRIIGTIVLLSVLLLISIIIELVLITQGKINQIRLF